MSVIPLLGRLTTLWVHKVRLVSKKFMELLGCIHFLWTIINLCKYKWFHGVDYKLLAISRKVLYYRVRINKRFIWSLNSCGVCVCVCMHMHLSVVLSFKLGASHKVGKCFTTKLYTSAPDIIVMSKMWALYGNMISLTSNFFSGQLYPLSMC